MSEQLTQTTDTPQFDKTEWTRTQYQKANHYLASKGIVPDNVAISECRYLPPFLAIWKLVTKSNEAFWVISGELPTDHIKLSAAEDAREALRVFSLQWQMKAQQIINSGTQDKTQLEFANLLVTRAHNLYEMFSNDELWQAQT